MIEEIQIKLQSRIMEGYDVSNLNKFDSINYKLPEKYKNELELINGKIYCSYLASDETKKLGKQNNINTYWVNDDSLECLCVGMNNVVQAEQNWLWKDKSGKGNDYIIYNYNENCIKENGIELSINNKVFLKDNKYETAKTAIITISNFKEDGKEYKLFRGDANNFYSTISINNNILDIAFRTFEKSNKNSIDYIDMEVTNEKNTEKIQIASTISDAGIQKIYINGNLVGIKDRETNRAVIFTKNIGGRYNPYNEVIVYEANYEVNSVQLYSRELTEKEIENNYNADLSNINW